MLIPIFIPSRPENPREPHTQIGIDRDLWGQECIVIWRGRGGDYDQISSWISNQKELLADLRQARIAYPNLPLSHSLLLWEEEA